MCKFMKAMKAILHSGYRTVLSSPILSSYYPFIFILPTSPTPAFLMIPIRDFVCISSQFFFIAQIYHI